MRKIVEKIVFDMTGFESSIKSLEKLTNIDARKIFKYISERKEKYDVGDFLGTFNIREETLLSKELELVSLHVTTTFDDLATVKEFGLINLQQAVTLDTPFRRYLKEKEIFVDVEKKEIHHKGNIIDISKEWDGLHGDGYEKQLNWVVYKLFIDNQVSAFFYTPNALDYGGDVRRGPEFLINLTRLLKDSSIENDWKSSSIKKCYVLKFVSPLSDYEVDSFYSSGGLNRDNINLLDEDEIPIEKIKSLIEKALRHIHDFVFYSVDECFSYVRSNVIIPFNQITDIYTEEEYLEEYNIK
ncbi:hypothetical protein U9J35_17270 [Rossellomorea aquimaris]|nr:hypothetical protein [Rossellomorea aquimaris]WRP05651.1 hypothetical protein U9J35_17270 [Rossellomorea aquimaris]